MKVYGVIYGSDVISFVPSAREAIKASYEYGAKVGPDPKHPRQKHFLEWAKLHNSGDDMGGWSDYIDALEDRNVGVTTICIPHRSLKTLVCLGLDSVQENVSAKLKDILKSGGRCDRGVDIDTNKRV
jgi:hypothetical protein